ncbi:MAG TPA: hypothetical protein PKC44_07290 [Agitococcus sp.]|nr:hypothetical protein [Agitococcus sp.]
MSSKLEQVKCILLEAAKSIEGRTEFEFDPDDGSVSLGSKNLLITFEINNVGELYEELYINCESEETGEALLGGYTTDEGEDVWDVEKIKREVMLAVTYFGMG